MSAYFCSKTFVETLFQIPFPIIFSLTVYWLIGFQNEAPKFFIFMAFMMLCHFSALAVATAVSAIGRTTEVAVTILPAVLEITRLFGGFYLSPRDLPGYFAWLDAISYLKYTYTGISWNELTDLEYHCTETQLVPGLNGTSTCPITSGEQVSVHYCPSFRFTCADFLVSFLRTINRYRNFNDVLDDSSVGF